MSTNATSCVTVNGTLSEGFMVKVGVHQGSVLSPLLFIMVFEAMSRVCIWGCPQELYYADDLVPLTESMEELIEKFKKWTSDPYNNVEKKYHDIL